MERSFTLDIFSEKKGIIPPEVFIFSWFYRNYRNICIICDVKQVPCCLINCVAVIASIRGLSAEKCTGGKFSLVFPTNGLRSPVRFCLQKNRTVPSGRKFSPVFRYKWKALLTTPFLPAAQIILQPKIYQVNYHCRAVRNRNLKNTVHIARVLIGISGTCQCIVYH